MRALVAAAPSCHEHVTLAVMGEVVKVAVAAQRVVGLWTTGHEGSCWGQDRGAISPVILPLFGMDTSR